VAIKLTRNEKGQTVTWQAAQLSAFNVWRSGTSRE
jgi:hypothetical protein